METGERIHEREESTDNTVGGEVKGKRTVETRVWVKFVNNSKKEIRAVAEEKWWMSQRVREAEEEGKRKTEEKVQMIKEVAVRMRRTRAVKKQTLKCHLEESEKREKQTFKEHLYTWRREEKNSTLKRHSYFINNVQVRERQMATDIQRTFSITRQETRAGKWWDTGRTTKNKQIPHVKKTFLTIRTVRNAETEERKKSTEEALNRWFYLITFANSDRLEKKQ